jgi:hypothetical protein
MTRPIPSAPPPTIRLTTHYDPDRAAGVAAGAEALLTLLGSVAVLDPDRAPRNDAAANTARDAKIADQEAGQHGTQVA